MMFRFRLRLIGNLTHTTTAAALLGGTILASDKNSYNDPSYHDRIVGNYENRIRKFSSPERVFEYFASVQTDSGFFMTEYDFIRSITPYAHRSSETVGSPNVKYNFKTLYEKPKKNEVEAYFEFVKKIVSDGKVDPSEIKALSTKQAEWNIDLQAHIEVLKRLNLTLRQFEELVEEKGGPSPQRTFFNMVDGDGDGLISYPEYMFYMTMLAIPEHKFEIAFKMFDTDESGTIDQFEFKEMMHVLQLSTPVGKQDRSLSVGTVPAFANLFGADGSKSLTFQEFNDFRQKLHDEVLKLQFEQYDIDGNKELSAREFGMYLVSFVKQNQMDFWVKRVDMLTNMNIVISEAEFKNFSVFLGYLNEMEVAMSLSCHGQRGLNKRQFLHAARAATMGKQILTQRHVDILFALFDINGDGTLDVKEFIQVMKKRSSGGTDEERGLGVMSWASNVFECIKNSIQYG